MRWRTRWHAEALHALDRELFAYRDLARKGIADCEYFPRLLGTADTNLGKGLVVERIVGDDGTAMITLADWLAGGTSRAQLPQAKVRSLCSEFADFCLEHHLDFTGLHFENIGFVRRGPSFALVAFDIKHLPDKTLIPLSIFIPYFKRVRIRERIDRLMARIDAA